MAIFEIEAGGKTYEIDAPDQAAAIAAFDQMQSPPPGYGGADVDASTPARSDLARAARAAALPVAGLEKSILETVAAPAELFWKGYRGIGLPGGSEPGAATRTLKSIFMPGQAPESETTAEKFLEGAGRGAGDVASFMVPGAAAARIAQAGSLPARVGAQVASQPAAQGAVGAAAGGVSEATDSPMAGLATALALPFAAAGSRAAQTALSRPMTGPVPAADALIARTFANVDTATAMDRLKQARQLKEPVTLADLGSEQTKRLARAAAGEPGEGTDIAVKAVRGAQRGMSDRIWGDVNRAFKGDDVFETETKLLGTLRENAAEAYGRFRDRVPQVWSKDLGEMFNKRPSMKEAIGVAMRNAAEEGRPFGITRAKDGKFMSAEDFQKGEAIQALTPSAVDDVKKALDGIIDANKNEFTGKLNNYGRLVAQTKERFLGAVERADLTGLYKKARAQYAGDAEVIQALRDGREFNKLDPREITARMKNMSFAERDAYRTGAMNTIIENLGKTPRTHDASKAIFRDTPWKEEQVSAILTPSEYKRLKAAVDVRKEAFETRQFVSPRTGSQTQLRQADADSMSGQLIDIAGKAVTQGPTRALLSGVTDYVGRRAKGVTAKRAPEIARKLYTSDPRDIESFLRWMQAQQATQPGQRGILGPQLGRALAGQAVGQFRGLLGTP